MRIILLVSLIFLSSNILFAQNDKREYDKNAFLIGTLGYTQSIVAASYEGIFRPTKNDRFLWATRIGVGFIGGMKAPDEKDIITTVPIIVSGLIRVSRNKSFIQVSTGYAGSFGHNFIDNTSIPPQYTNAISHLLF